MQIRLNDRAAAAALLKVAAGFTGRMTDQQRFIRMTAGPGKCDVLAAGEMGTAQVVLECDTIEPGEALVRADMAVGIITRMPDSRLTLAADAKGLRIRGGSGAYKVPVLTASDWLYGARRQPADALVLDAAKFIAALEFAAAAAGVNDVRFFLNGVFIEIRDDGMNAVGTDGHRLNRASIPAPADAARFPSFIVPARAADKLANTLSREGTLALWMEGASYCLQDASGFTFAGVAIDGAYPDWRKAVPGGGVVVDLDTVLLAGALDRALVVSADAPAKWVGMTVEGGTSLRVEFTGSLGELNETLDCEAPGPAVATLNPEYVLGALSAFGKRPKRLVFNDKVDSPFRIESFDGERTAVIMPVRV